MGNQVDVNDRRVRYIWTTGAQVFDIDFPLNLATDLAVYKNAGGTPLDPSTYVVDLEAMTVTITPGLTSGDVIVLEGLEALQRTVGYPLRGDLRSALLNGDVNAIYYALQEMRRDIDRSLVLDKSAPNTIDPTIPAPVANAMIIGNADGTGFTVGPTTQNIDILAAIAAGLAAIAADLSNIDAVAADLANIDAAGANAEAAAASASSASTDAGTATTQAGIATSASGTATTASTTATTQAGNAAASAAAAQAAANAMANQWLFNNSTTMADPGTATFRLNNATPGSVTNIAFSASTNDAGTPNIHAYLMTWDDSNHTPRGVIRMDDDNGNFLYLGINGSITDGTSWVEVPVTIINAVGTFTSGSDIYVNFVPYGNDGTGTLNAQGTPTAGALVQWYDGTHLENADLTGDVTTSGGLATAIKSSVNLSGNPTTTTQASKNNSTKIATTAYADAVQPGAPQRSVSAATTTVLADANGSIYHPSADTTARIWTIDSNANVAYPVGTMLTFINDTSAGAITIAITSDTLVLAGTGTTGSRTLAASGMATAYKKTSTSWMISGSGLT